MEIAHHSMQAVAECEVVGVGCVHTEVSEASCSLMWVYIVIG